MYANIIIIISIINNTAGCLSLVRNPVSIIAITIPNKNKIPIRSAVFKKAVFIFPTVFALSLDIFEPPAIIFPPVNSPSIIPKTREEDVAGF